MVATDPGPHGRRVVDRSRLLGFSALVWEDLRGPDGALGLVAKALFDPGFHLLVSHRITHRLARSCLRFLNLPLMWWQYVLFGCYISPQAMIGRRVRFPHPIGIVIGETAVVGDDAVIFQQVTLGNHGRMEFDKEYPVIGARTRICAGAKVIGGIRVGAGATVGANAVVRCDVPDGALAVGVPAQIRRRRP